MLHNHIYSTTLVFLFLNKFLNVVLIDGFEIIISKLLVVVVVGKSIVLKGLKRKQITEKSMCCVSE